MIAITDSTLAAFHVTGLHVSLVSAHQTAVQVRAGHLSCRAVCAAFGGYQLRRARAVPYRGIPSVAMHLPQRTCCCLLCAVFFRRETHAIGAMYSWEIGRMCFKTLNIHLIQMVSAFSTFGHYQNEPESTSPKAIGSVWRDRIRAGEDKQKRPHHCNCCTNSRSSTKLVHPTDPAKCLRHSRY